ncbi:MAG: exodeoxyribonuclease VII small subunit [Parcubacteria group bacterium]|nr:exodeoxyribonuclease VII small subunit [Parcubacteria group bacterium]
MEKKESISKLLADLESAIGWFEKQNDLDLEEGLKKVREGADLIKELKKRLQDVENEFSDIKKELEE